MDHWNWPRIRDILICVIGLGIILWASGSVLGQFFDAIVILLLSMAVAFLLTPAVNLLVRTGMPRLLATVVAFIIVIAAIIGFGYELISSLAAQVSAFSDKIVSFTVSLPETSRAVLLFLEKQANIPAENIQAALNQIQASAYDFARSFAFSAPAIFTSTVNAFLNILLVGVLSFYLTLDGKRMRDSIISIAPKRSLPNVLLFEDALNRVVGNYIRGQLFLALIIGIGTGLVCATTGLGQFALICGVLAFLFETIPMLGPALASITPLLLSLLLPDPFPRTLIVALCFVALQVIESNVLGPRIVGHAVGLHPVAAILSLLVFAKLFGVFGALIATPIVAAVWVVVASIYRSARGETADQILANKRAPWTIRRPYGRQSREQGEAGDEDVEHSTEDIQQTPANKQSPLDKSKL